MEVPNWITVAITSTNLVATLLGFWYQARLVRLQKSLEYDENRRKELQQAIAIVIDAETKMSLDGEVDADSFLSAFSLAIQTLVTHGHLMKDLPAPPDLRFEWSAAGRQRAVATVQGIRNALMSELQLINQRLRG